MAIGDKETRRCIVTRASGGAAGLIRFVVDPDGGIVPDVDGKLPGRGLYLTPDPALFAKAVKAKAFARAARTAVVVPDDLIDLTVAALVRRIGQGIAMANRAGLVAAGFEKARMTVREGPVALILTAADAAPDGVGKLAALAKGMEQPAPRRLPQDAEALGALLGRAHAVHCVVRPGGLAERLDRSLTLWEKLSGGGSNAGVLLDAAPGNEQDRPGFKGKATSRSD